MKHSLKFAIVLFPIALIIIAILSIIGLATMRHTPLRIQGTIEAPNLRIAGKLPGRVTHLYVAEGDKVSRGDTLISIYSPEVEAKYTQAYSLEEAARAQSQKADEGAPSEAIEAAKEMWLGAKAQRQLAQKSYERIKRLAEEGVVSLQRKDEVEALYNTALASEKAAYQQYMLLKKGAQKRDKESAQYVADAAAGTTEEVVALLADSHLTAPTDGIVSAIYPEVGELVGTGTPLMSIVELTSPYAVFNVREDLMPHFRLGDVLRGNIPALALEATEWRVDYIAPLGDYATWDTSLPESGYDMRTFEIHARPTEPIADVRPGMSIIIELGS